MVANDMYLSQVQLVGLFKRRIFIYIEMLFLLCPFLRQFIPRYPMKGTTLRNISEMCLPILLKPVVRPLVSPGPKHEYTENILQYFDIFTPLHEHGYLA